MKNKEQMIKQLAELPLAALLLPIVLYATHVNEKLGLVFLAIQILLLFMQIYFINYSKNLKRGKK